MTKEREPLISLALYHLFKWSVVSPALHTYFQGRIYGADHVPQKGPLLVVSNHSSDFDPPIVSNCVRRPVAFMAKQELFEVPVLATLIRWYGAYPVNRGGSTRSAIKASIAALEAGWATGVFLQGTRTKDGRITDPKLGAAMIASKAQVPLLPVSLWGTEKVLVKGKKLPQVTPITVRIGEPIAPPKSGNRDQLNAVTERCAEIINAMHALGR
ncbi:MAG: lysophospholipid acyltransferase family protein [Thermosynechococcaceae cyanobacterium]